MKISEIVEKYQSLEYERLETLRAMKAVEDEFNKDFQPYTAINWKERNNVYKLLNKHLKSIIDEINKLKYNEEEVD